MKNIVVMPNLYKDPACDLTKKIIEILRKNKAEVFLHQELTNLVPDAGIHFYGEDFPKQAELILVVGGDGSILDAAVHALRGGIPLLGINLGRLGYLSELEADEIDVLDRLFTGEFTVRRHITLSVTLVQDGVRSNPERCAVNDVVIGDAPNFGMSELLLEDGVGNHLNYRADGIIASTPLGSTAYSLAAGGPVVDGSLKAICVTPICAHSFFGRSVLFPPEYRITVTNVSGRGGDVSVSIDGGEAYRLKPGDQVEISQSRDALQMISLKNRGVLDVLCRKMQLLS